MNLIIWHLTLGLIEKNAQTAFFFLVTL